MDVTENDLTEMNMKRGHRRVMLAETNGVLALLGSLTHSLHLHSLYSCYKDILQHAKEYQHRSHCFNYTDNMKILVRILASIHLARPSRHAHRQDNGYFLQKCYMP